MAQSWAANGRMRDGPVPRDKQGERPLIQIVAPYASSSMGSARTTEAVPQSDTIQSREPEGLARRRADVKKNCRAIGVGAKFTARLSPGFGVMSKHVTGRAPRKARPLGPGVCRARRRVSGAVAAAQSSKPGSMSSLHAASLAHRREGARKIVMTLCDFANQRDE